MKFASFGHLDGKFVPDKFKHKIRSSCVILVKYLIPMMRQASAIMFAFRAKTFYSIDPTDEETVQGQQNVCR